MRQVYAFSPDLFNINSDSILRELETQPGFIIGRRKLNNIKFEDDTVLMAETEISSKNVVLQTDTENSLDGTSKQQESFKEKKARERTRLHRIRK